MAIRSTHNPLYLDETSRTGKIEQYVAPPGAPEYGQEAYTTAGTYTWIAPAKAATWGIHIVAVGGGAGATLYPNGITGGSGGGGGALSWKNNHPVTEGESYTVVVGAPGRGGHSSPATPSSTEPYSMYPSPSSESGGYSTLRTPTAPTTHGDSVVYASGGEGSLGPSGGAGGSTRQGDGGGNGGQGGSQNGYSSYWSFGGGAGGYSGNGGNGGVWQAGGPYEVGASAAAPGSGGAGGAASWGNRCGVGITGKGPDGAINSPGSYGTSTGYGGGGSTSGSSGAGPAQSGQPGAVRIIWGPNRQFPDTDTHDVV